MDVTSGNSGPVCPWQSASCCGRPTPRTPLPRCFRLRLHTGWWSSQDTTHSCVCTECSPGWQAFPACGVAAPLRDSAAPLSRAPSPSALGPPRGSPPIGLWGLSPHPGGLWKPGFPALSSPPFVFPSSLSPETWGTWETTGYFPRDSQPGLGWHCPPCDSSQRSFQGAFLFLLLPASVLAFCDS